MSPRSHLARIQRQRLTEIAELQILTDESLAAHLRALEIPCDRSTLVRYRSGERTAPLALLDLILGHCDEGERIAVLEIWARPFGLLVVPQELSAGERWQIRQRAAELRRQAAELETLVGREAA